MLSQLRIVHPPSSDNPTNLPVLVLSIDSKRFIFNTPEGLTRILVQRGARGASKGLQGVFVPRTGCVECAGLPGLLMTLADQGKKEVNVTGPPVLSHYMATARSFVRRYGFSLNLHELPLQDTVAYRDQSITIRAVPLFPTGSSAESSSVSQRVRQCLSNMFNGNGVGGGGLAEKLEAPSISPVELTNAPSGQAPVLLYIVDGSATRGKFDIEKARALGIPDPKTYKILASGKDVQFERPKAWLSWSDAARKEWLKRPVVAEGESETVTALSKEVVAPSQPGTAFAQVYLPSIDYLDSFFDSASSLFVEEMRDRLHVLVHAVHPDVLHDERYQRFIKALPTTNHYISSRPFVSDKIAYPSAALSTLRMSYLDSTLFRVPQYSLQPRRTLAQVGLDLPNVSPLGAETEISLHPRRAPEYVKPEFDWTLDSSEAAEAASTPTRWTRYIELADQLQEEEAKRNSLGMDNVNDKDRIKITSLGTGSALPSKYRNVSATLIHLPGDAGYILLDAGEGTYGQLCRRFGADVDDVMRSIRFIFLSHIHGDHHMGMSRLLSERKRLQVDEPLIVLSNRATRTYLLEQNDIQGLIDERTTFRDNEEFLKAGDVQTLSVQTALVDHRVPHCYAIVVRGHDWSVAYSGDTRPCDAFVAAARGVDVLIHEATFEDGEEAMAHKKGHSTVGQAINAARRMGARRVLLTHFSQRYPKLPHVADTFREGVPDEPSVGVAFDLMTIALRDIGKTERYREALQVLFDEDEERERQHELEQEREREQVQVQEPKQKKQRKFVKKNEFVYVVAMTRIVDRLAFHGALQEALEELHGVVGASFHRDLLLFRREDEQVRVVIKCASTYAQTLSSTLSMLENTHLVGFFDSFSL